MTVALWILAAIAVLLGLAGVVLPAVPGLPLLFGGLWLAAWLDGFSKVGPTTVGLLAALALLGWAAEYAASALGVKRVGASAAAIAGAALGTLLGIFGGLPGLVLGPMIGAALGEWVARRDHRQATRAGIAAGLGFIAAVAAKLGIATAMLAVFAFSWLV